MKRILLSLTLSLIFLLTFAQDIIVTSDASKIDAIIIEVSETEVKYKKANNPDGPTFIIKTDKIASIVYQNGDVQTFATAQQTMSSNSSPSLHDIARLQEEKEGLWHVQTPAEGPWLLYGLNVKEGLGLYIKSSATDGNTEYRSAAGLRFLPNPEAYLEFAPKQMDMADNRRAIYLGLQYAFRGGTISSDVQNTPVYLDLQYFCFRPAYSYNTRTFYSRTGMELGVLTKATYEDARYLKSSVRDGCNKATFGIWEELGGVIMDHFTIGVCFEYIVSNSTKDVWSHKCYSPHVNIQLALGWRFNPYKFDKKKVEKIKVQTN